jgi:uncharacterized protein YqeY
MSLIAQIKKDLMTARKARQQFEINSLTTLVGEAEMIGKNAGNRETTDEEVIKLIGKTVSGINDTVKLLPSTDARVADMLKERELISKYLPQAISDEKVKEDIAAVLKTFLLKVEPKSMGVVSKSLKEAYGLQYDGAQVSRIFKTL